MRDVCLLSIFGMIEKSAFLGKCFYYRRGFFVNKRINKPNPLKEIHSVTLFNPDGYFGCPNAKCED